MRAVAVRLAVALAVVFAATAPSRGEVVLTESIVNVTRIVPGVAEQERHFWPMFDPPPDPMIDFRIEGENGTAEVHAEFDQVDGRLRSLAANGTTTNSTENATQTISTFAPSFMVTDDSESVYVGWTGTATAPLNFFNLYLVRLPTDQLNDPSHPIPIRQFRDQATSFSSELRDLFTLAPGEYKIVAQALDNAEFDIAVRFGAALWREPASGTFGDTDRWVGNVVPIAGDELIFDAVGAPYTVSFDDSYAARSMLVRQGQVALDLGSNTFSVDEFTIQPGSNDPVSLTLTGTGVGGPVGAADAGGGPMFSSPPPSSPTTDFTPQVVSSALNVSGGLRTNLEIAASSIFQRSDLNSVATVSGDGTVMQVGEAGIGGGRFRVGNAGFGELTVDEGATLFSFVETVLGDGNGNTGFVNIDGFFTAFEHVTVGRGGRGKLDIRGNGSAVFLNGLSIGTVQSDDAGVSLTSNASAEAVQVAGALVVGEAGGIGNLFLSTNAILTNPDGMRLRMEVSQTGAVRAIEGAILTAQQFDIGTGIEMLGGRDSAAVEINGQFVATAPAGVSGNNGVVNVGVSGQGVVTVRTTDGNPAPGGSTIPQLSALRELNVGRLGAIDVHSSGAVVVGRTAVAGDEGKITVATGGRLSGQGSIQGNVRLAGGTVAPGSSPGTLTVDGDFDQEMGGVLEMEFAGAGEGEFDRLVVTGDVNVDGTVVLKFLDGYAPRRDDAFMLLDVGGALTTGPNANFVVENLAPDFLFDVSLESGSLTMVALNDATFVPEPSTYLLALVGAFGLAFCRRRASLRR